MASQFSDRYPTIDQFVLEEGWIEIGYDHENQSFIRALDLGGCVWEGKYQYNALDEALADLEHGLIEWLKER